MKTSIAIEWFVEDIHTVREELKLSKITDKEAIVFLNSIEKPLTDGSIVYGWEVIKDLLDQRGE
tara:strand:+ start:389 stop:580 length:192 start_codon:yes stop_codon:yes gene_type:complete